MCVCAYVFKWEGGLGSVAGLYGVQASRQVLDVELSRSTLQAFKVTGLEPVACLATRQQDSTGGRHAFDRSCPCR